jgi:CubicO group peptidase (beta-lactamase class C family)
MAMRYFTVLICGVILAMLPAFWGCSTMTAAPGHPLTEIGAPAAYYPEKAWRTSTPEEQGIDSRGIVQMLEKIVHEGLPVHGFLLIRNGFLVSEAYFAPAAGDQTHLLYSMTKSVTSTLVGIAISEGFIKGVDQKVLDFFPQIKEKNSDAYLTELTIENLLTMSAGYADIIAPGPDAAVDWVQALLSKPIADKPGSTFLYNSGAAHVLSAIIEIATGRTEKEYAREKLFTPLGIDEFYWLADSMGRNFGNSWLKLRPVDMVKFGYLFLNKGLWNGRQTVPKDWVEKSTMRHMDTRGTMNIAEDDGYGYLWWMNSFGGFSAHGFGGQYIFVLPRFNTVAVFTGGFPNPVFPTSHELMRTYIVPALRSSGPLPKNEESSRALAEIVGAGSRPPVKTQTVLPETAMEVSGRTYRLQPNPMGYKNVTLDFEKGNEYRLVVESTNGGTERSIEYCGGLDDAYRLNNDSPDPSWTNIVGLKGVWLDDGSFMQYECTTDGIGQSTFQHTFDVHGIQFIHIIEYISGKITGSGILVGYAEE